MPKKSVWEMNRLEKNHFSLEGKTVRAIMMLTLVIGLAAIGFGFFLYSATVNREYRIKAWQNARTAAKAINLEEVKREAEIVSGIYAGLGGETQSWEDPEYLAECGSVKGSESINLRAQMFVLMKAADARACYIAMIDPAQGRMIFLNGATEENSFPQTGVWEEIDAKTVRSFLEGAPPRALDAFYDTPVMPSFMYHMAQMGYRCTAGEKLFSVNGMEVLAFVDEDMNHIAAVSRMFLLQYVLLIVAVMVIVSVFSIFHIKRTMVRPINDLASAAMAYISDRDDVHRNNRYFSKLNIRTGDEIENLSLTMKAMESELADYVHHITRITAEKERVSTELSLATRIQADMLPNIFPAFPERKEFDIFASMNPAKEVGGDFYDFFLIDQERLGIVIADVSGKGVPAALFMMASKIIIKNYALAGFSPAAALELTNEQICKNNREEMFVTAWMGILNLKDGTLTAASAGHEYPIIKRPGRPFELVRDKHGLVLGGMENVRYKDYELYMEPGTKLFLYTDGLPEATNSLLEQFGVNRSIETLNAHMEERPEALVGSVREAVSSFVGDAPQFDDLTMLCVLYTGEDEAG